MSRHNNDTVARLYAEGETFAHGSNLFIDGETIYSYGYHYPIASRWRTPAGEWVALFNSYGSTVTTEKHKRIVRRALSTAGWDVINVPSAGYGSFRDAIRQNTERLEFVRDKLSRARTERSRHAWNREIDLLSRETDKIKTFINTEANPTL